MTPNMKSKMPDWIVDLESVLQEAEAKATAANKSGDDFWHGYHAGRAQVLESWIASAKISARSEPKTNPASRPNSEMLSGTA